MILIVSSGKDVASINIAKKIVDHHDFRETTETFQRGPTYLAELGGKKIRLITLEEESIYAQNLMDFFAGMELVVFVSRHSSVSGTPTLSVHTPGNLSQAELGGLPRRVSVSPANAMRDALKVMMQSKEEIQLDYEVSYECTHHGPSLDMPTMFAELGSSPRQWNDLKAAEVVAKAVMEAISNFGKSQSVAVLGIGGPHYNKRFTHLALENEMAFGHIIPKYAIPCVDAEILKQCVEKTVEKVESAVLDWKGIKGEHKSRLVEMLKEIGIPIQKI